MKKLDGWLTYLNLYVDRVWRTPFDYGSHDCALYAAGGVQAQTGIDPAADMRGQYSTLAGGLKLLRKKGFANHADYAASFLAEVHPSLAQLGDIAAIPVAEGTYALGIVGGAHILVVQPGVAGTGVVDLLSAERAFRVQA